jgi:hypothetical protein
MNLYEKIIYLYPDLTQEDFLPDSGTIFLQNDSDGFGDYIKHWNHPVYPEPTKEQLDSIQ